jgi:hypothetical protein
MILETPQGEAVTARAHTDSLSMGGATVRGLDLCVVNHYADRPPKVNGLLGEDFLRYFDLLLDNQHHLILLERGPGQLGEMFTGEHLPLSLNGFSEGKPMRNRLVVVGLIDKRSGLRQTETWMSSFSRRNSGFFTGSVHRSKAVQPRLKVIAVEPSESAVLSGGATGAHDIEGIGIGYRHLSGTRISWMR